MAPPDCPFGSVHNLNKVPVAARVVTILLERMGLQQNLSRGQRDFRIASATVSAGPEANWTLHLTFNDEDGPLHFRGTQNCATCCNSPASPGDFDVSCDGGTTYINGTMPEMVSSTVVKFTAATAGRPTHVRYTANQGFPQYATSYLSAAQPK